MADFFIRRPIVAMVIAILTVIVGLITLKRLPISESPVGAECLAPWRLRAAAQEMRPHQRPRGLTDARGDERTRWPSRSSSVRRRWRDGFDDDERDR